MQGRREPRYAGISGRPRTLQRAAQRDTAAQGFILKRVLRPEGGKRRSPATSPPRHAGVSAALRPGRIAPENAGTRRRLARTGDTQEQRSSEMGVGVSLLLIAAGAILTWAVSAETSGIDLNTVGVILMVVGAVGLLLSLVFWSSWGGFGTHRKAVESGPGGTTVTEERVN